MKKLLITIAALTLLTGVASADDIVWDQSTIDPANSFMNSVSPGMWGTVMVYSASDVSIPVDLTITAVTTYYTNNGNWVAGSYPAVIDFYLKTGATPVTGTDDPLSGTAITAELVDVGGGVFELQATGLNIDLVAGDYWVLLTPEIPDGPSFREFQYAAATPLGDSSCNIELGGWLPPAWASVGMDGAIMLSIDGTVAIDNASWGELKAMYR